MHRVDDKTEIFERLRQAEPDLRALGVRRLGLFGSFARGQQTAESDIDLLVDFAPGEKTYDHLLAVGDLVETLLGRPVELVTIGALSPHLGPHILDEVEYAPLAA